MPAQFYDAAGEEEVSSKFWEAVLLAGDKMWTHVAVGRLHWDLSADQLLDFLRDRYPKDEVWPAIAEAYLLTDVDGGKPRALELFREFSSQNATLVDRQLAIHIPLLLGEKRLAMDTAQRWLDSMSTDSFGASSEFGEREFLRIIATDGDWKPTHLNRTTSLTTQHALGLLAIAEGKRELAIEHLTASTKKPALNLDSYWGEAFLRKLKNNDSWPRENKKLHR